jgi:flagellar biosynthesis protein FlhB
MAGERTEAPTPRRLQELKHQGSVIRSTDFNTAVSLLAGAVALRFIGPSVVEKMQELLKAAIEHPGSMMMDPDSVRFFALDTGLAAGLTIVPLLLAVIIAGVCTNWIQVGTMFNVSAAAPKFNRINPISGFQRLLSMQGMVEMGKSCAKLLIAGGVIYSTVQDQQGAIVLLVSRDLMSAASWLADLSVDVMIRVGVVFLVISAADYVFQRHQFMKNAKMTKEQVKEEMKSSEGSPEMKARMRQVARSLTMNRMMSDAATADVIITNPTHLAVAIKYEMGSRAPKVVAKGPNLIAERIKQIARDKSIPIIENRPLAQALYKAVEVGDEVPAQLYQVVAEILAFIYRLRAPRTNLRTAGSAGVA